MPITKHPRAEVVPRPPKKKIIAHEPGPLARAARIRSDAARHAYVRARSLLTQPWNYARSRAAKRVNPGRFAIDRSAGFLLLPAGALPFGEEVVTESLRALDRFLRDPERMGSERKPFLINVLKREALTVDSSFVRLALSPEVLAAVSAYLGVVPLLTAVQVFHSDVMTTAPQSSQLFHCDGDDVEQIKVFVLCSNVALSGGPLTVLPAASSERVRQATGYNYRQRLTDEQVSQAGGRHPTPIVGPPGTAVLVDTSRCFHFGSRVSPDAPPRLVAMIQYQTPYSFMLPVIAHRAAPFRHLAGVDMPQLDRMVLGSE